MIIETCKVSQSRRVHNFDHYKCLLHIFFSKSLAGKEGMDPIFRVALPAIFWLRNFVNQLPIVVIRIERILTSE